MRDNRVHVCLTPRPMAEAITDLIPAGPTVADIIRRHDCEHLLLAGVTSRCFLDGVELGRELWEDIKPRSGQILSAQMAPGDDAANAFLSLGVVAASIFTGGLAGAAYGAFWGSVVGGATLFGGNMLKNAIAPPQGPSLGDRTFGSSEQLSPALAITGTSNQARKYQPVAMVLGKVRRYPDLQASSYTEISGDDVFYRMYFNWGKGKLALSDLKLGETPLDDLEEWEMQASNCTIDGVEYPEQELSLYANDVYEESVSIALDGYDSETEEGGEWQERTGQPDCDEDIFDLYFPEGLLTIGSGANSSATVVFMAQYCNATEEEGAENWIDFPGAAENGEITETAKYEPSRRVSYRVEPGYRGQRRYRWKRVTPATTDNLTRNTIAISAIRNVTHESPVRRDRMTPQTEMVLRFRANGQVNGIIDQLNGIAESIIPVWDGTEWTDQISRSPAWHIVNQLRGNHRRKPVADSRLDLAGFLAWDQRCAARGWHIDAVVDFKILTMELVGDIAAVGRASFGMKDSLFSIVEDRPQTVCTQMFSPKNSWGAKWEKEHPDPPHAIRCTFNNADAGYQQDEITVYRPGYSEDGADGTIAATDIETDSLWGVTDSAHVQDIEMRQLMTPDYRPEKWTRTTGIEGMCLRRGQLVVVADDLIGVGMAQGRIKSVETNEADKMVAVTVDEPCIMETGKTYVIKVRQVSGSYHSAQVVTDPTEPQRLAFPDPLAVTFERDDYFHFGEGESVDEEFIVTDLSYGQDDTVTMELVHHAPGLDTVGLGEFPSFVSNITSPAVAMNPAPPVPVIIGATSDRVTATPGADGVPAYAIQVKYQLTSGMVRASGARAQYRESGGEWKGLPGLDADDTFFMIQPVNGNETYDVRVRAVTQSGAASAWAELLGIIVDTDSWDGPAAPVITHQIKGEHVVLSWQDCKTDLPIREYVLVGDTDDVGLGPGLSTSERITWSGAKTWAIKAVDVAGNESAAVEHSVSVEAIPMPISLVAEGVTHGVKVTITHDVIDTLDGIEVWASQTNDRAYAGMVGMTRDGDLVHDGLGLVDHRFYWCRGRDIYGTTGDWYPSNDKLGVRGDTDAVNANIPEHSLEMSHLASEFEAITGPICFDDDVFEDVFVQQVSDVRGLDIRTEDNAASLQVEQLARIAGDTALAQRTETVETTVGEHTATIQEQATSIDGVTAMKVVQVNANGEVAGFGAYAGLDGSEIAFQADKFLFVTEEGGARIAAFQIVDGNVYIAQDLIAAGSIGALKIGANAINGTHIYAQSDIGIAEGGSFSAGDGNLRVDTFGNNTTFVMGEDGTVDSQGSIDSTKNRVQMTGTEIEFWRYIEGESRLFNALKRVETGWVENGATKDIDGYWTEAPEVYLSPRNLATFDQASNTVDQAIDMQVTDIELIPEHTNRYRFTSNARLVIAAGTSDFVVDEDATTDQENGVAQTSAYVTPAYCTAASIDYRIKAVKPMVNSGTYQRRQVTLKVYVDGSLSATRTIAVGDTIDYLTGTVSVSGLASSAAGHSIYLTAQAVDASGTFVTTVLYEYEPGSASTSWAEYEKFETSGSVSFDQPDPTPSGSGWVLNGSVTYAYQFLGAGTMDDKVYNALVSCSGGTIFSGLSSGGYSGSGTMSAFYSSATFSSSTSSGASLMSVTVSANYKRPLANSDTLSTYVEFDSVTVTLAAANVLAEGTANFMAIGK